MLEMSTAKYDIKLFIFLFVLSLVVAVVFLIFACGNFSFRINKFSWQLLEHYSVQLNFTQVKNNNTLNNNNN